jgi:ATP-dependent DNA helicase 2 subunit 1
MFEIIDADGLNHFEKSMRVIQTIYQKTIHEGDKDFLGILFFGTEVNNTSEDFKHIYMLQNLKQPHAECIKQIEHFATSKLKKKFEYGHSDEFNLDKVFWYCSKMFSEINKKTDAKRMMMFTHNSIPHKGNKSLEKLAINKAKDLYDIGIVIELFPLIEESGNFNYSLFYRDILMLSDEQIQTLSHPAENLKNLEIA